MGDLSEEDALVLSLVRKLRAASVSEYQRFMRLALLSLEVAELPSHCRDSYEPRN